MALSGNEKTAVRQQVLLMAVSALFASHSEPEALREAFRACRLIAQDEDLNLSPEGLALRAELERDLLSLLARP